MAGSLFAGAVWWTANTIYGDGLFHLARVRKLESFDLTSLSVVNEFRDGGLHPGYAFPLWHSACALIARLADVDPATALLHLPAILTPLAVVLAYAAGAALFRSPGAGVATAVAQVGLIGFSRSGTGSFDFMAQPATVSRALIAPALLALVFSFVGGGRRRQVLSIAAASLALALVHPTYAFFVAVPLLGFLIARAILATSRWRELLRVGATLPAVLLPAGLFALWLKPIVDETVSHRPDAEERARAIFHYGRQIDVVDGMLRLAPEQISRGGAIAVAGLLAIPIAGLAAPKRWSAYVLGGSLAVLGLVLVPWAFDHLTDVVSVSQGRRLAAFIPIPFAIAGAASVLGRYRLAGCLAAFGCGALLQLVYPGEHSYFLVEGGPGWPVWVALGGAAIALVAGAIVRRSVPLGPPIWTAAVALALVAPVGLAGFAYLEQDEPDRFRLTPGSHPGAPHRGPGARRRLLRPRDELPHRGLRTGLRLGRPACACRRHEGQLPAEATRGGHPLPEQRQRLDPASLPRRLDRDREAALRPPARPAEGLRGLALHALPAQAFAALNVPTPFARVLRHGGAGDRG